MDSLSSMLGPLAVMVAILLVAFFLTATLTKGRYRKLEGLVRAGDVEGFERLVSSRASRIFLSEFSLEYLRLQALGMSPDTTDEQLRDQVDHLVNVKGMGTMQTRDALAMSFTLLVRRGDVEGVRQLLEVMDQCYTEDAMAAYRLYFDVAMDGSASHRKELEAKLSSLGEDAKARTRGYFEFLLARTWENAGDAAKAKPHRARAAELLGADPEGLDAAVNFVCPL